MKLMMGYDKLPPFPIHHLPGIALRVQVSFVMAGHVTTWPDVLNDAIIPLGQIWPFFFFFAVLQ